MKSYAIYDDELNKMIGTLLYYDIDNSYVIELVDDLDEWSAPLLFTNFVKRNIYTIPRDISYIWVKERIIPSGRQNINSILNTHKLREYNEFKMLELSLGRCSQDNLYIKKIDSLPEYVIKRMERNLSEVLIIDNGLICFYNDGRINKIKLSDLNEFDDIEKLKNNKLLFESGVISPGGYAVTFNNSIDIPAYMLYELGIIIPLSKNDFITFVNKNVLDTTDATELLKCSRQNIAYLNNQEELRPLKKEVRGNLYLKGDLIRTKW